MALWGCGRKRASVYVVDCPYSEADLPALSSAFAPMRYVTGCLLQALWLGRGVNQKGRLFLSLFHSRRADIQHKVSHLCGFIHERNLAQSISKYPSGQPCRGIQASDASWAVPPSTNHR